jgi:hypothetical protein
MNSVPQYPDSNAMSAMIAMLMPILIIGLIIGVFSLICYWKVYTKAGKPGWACLVPFYNLIVLLQIAGKPWWWLLLMFIPFVNIILIIMVMHSLSLAFGKGAGFTVGLIFLTPIFMAILAFGSATYKGPGGDDGAVPAFA